jgi:hypothetical protein
VNDNRPARGETPREPSGPGRRVTVSSPRTRAARPAPRGEVARDLDEQTQLGEVYIASLVRAQLRLALTVCSVFGCLLGGLPLLFALQPAFRDLRMLGVPLAWLVLGVVVYPALLAGAWFYVRQAEHNERDFVDLVERS